MALNGGGMGMGALIRIKGAKLIVVTDTYIDYFGNPYKSSSAFHRFAKIDKADFSKEDLKALMELLRYAITHDRPIDVLVENRKLNEEEHMDFLLQANLSEEN